MPVPKTIPILVMVLLACSATAMGAAFQTEPATVFLQDRVRDGRSLIEGPRAPAPAAAVPAEWSCTELYARRVDLLRQFDDYKPSYWEDPRNRAAVFIGTMFPPAFYVLAYTGVTDYLDSVRGTRDEVRLEIDALRQASAYKQCFIK